MYDKMQIIVVAPAQYEAEFQRKFSGEHDYTFIADDNQIADALSHTDVVFDFLLQDNPQRLRLYRDQSGLVVFCNAVNISLAAFVHEAGFLPSCTLFGFNGWPGMIDRTYLEATLLHANDEPVLTEVCQKLGTEYLLVDDRVGLVTPRIISMIINEAFYTLQEGTATMPDIDLAMKLGTNYPFGPFEWAKKIGIRLIYQVLDALYQDTKDESYKICPLLKKHYLREQV